MLIHRSPFGEAYRAKMGMCPLATSKLNQGFAALFFSAPNVSHDDGTPLAGQIPPDLVTSKSPTLDERLTVR